MKANKLVLFYWNKVIASIDEKRKPTIPLPRGVESKKDIVYMDDGHPLHSLDIFRPKDNNDKLPVIFDIHGGGWYYGNKELNELYCQSLTAYGFAVVDISYRISPEADIFVQIQDCFRAMEFVKKHADEYKLDMDNFFITGDSAGGHIAALIANIVKSEYLQKRYNVEVCVQPKAVCLTCPALEPQAMGGGIAIMGIYFTPVFGKGYRKNDVKNVVSFKNTLQKNICPCFFISAYNDFLKKGTKVGYELVKAQGTDAEICFFDKPTNPNHNLQHVFNVMYWHWEESQEANKKMCEFFRKYIK